MRENAVEHPGIAYFSMEIALEPGIPTYAGGLGVLAGDILRSAADLEVPMIGVTLLHRKGYFRQHLDAEGGQSESPSVWSPEESLEPLDVRVSVQIEGREVRVRPWRFVVEGATGGRVPVLLLDTDLPENNEWDRKLTDHLYGGDRHYRICQEVVLGMGGVAVLDALDLDGNLVYHMNEGHSALLSLAIMEMLLGEIVDEEELAQRAESVRQKCVFTTHTPVPAGHDQFPREMVEKVLGPERTKRLAASGCLLDGVLNMTYLGLHCSRYINGVSMRHGEVSLGMFPGYPIHAITNGVHAATWVSPAFADLYDRHMPGWRHDNRYLRYAIQIPLHEIHSRHLQAKRTLLEEVNRSTGQKFREDVFTVGFARRATPYKRADLLLRDMQRLADIGRRVGPLQIVYAGKAHPNDQPGKDMIRNIFQRAKDVEDGARIAYLENYNMAVAKPLVAGADLWLNTPRRPQEASGTSGMKAACNGVPSLSVLDGWWIEGHVEGVTGWSIPHGHTQPEDEGAEVGALYDKLERIILPLYYGTAPAYAEVMRSTIALNASFFNTQRVVSQYLRNAYVGPDGHNLHISTGAL